MNRIDEVAAKVDKSNEAAAEKERRDKETMRALQARLDKIESNLNKNKEECEKKKDIERLERTNTFMKEVGLPENKVEERSKQTWSSHLQESVLALDDQKRKNREEQKMKHWTKKVQIKERIEKEKDMREKNDNENAARSAEQRKVEERREKNLEIEKKKDELKMGDNSSHDEADWAWDESDKEWEGTAEKKQKEREKKERRHRARANKVAVTANKARHIIGLGPIRQASIDYFHNITADFNTAKEMAVSEFLTEYLQFEMNEVEELIVLDTMIAKEPDIVYITFQDHDMIRTIQRRIAEVQREEIESRSYIPPQFWDRYSALNAHCRDLRSNNKDLKTLVKFGSSDLEVLVKDRSKEEHYTILPIEDIEKVSSIPKFNHKLVWRKRNDRPAAKKPTLPAGKIVPPSLKQSVSQSQKRRWS